MTTTTHPATVLVIEDDDASRMLLTYLLEAAGHRVLAAENGAVGLDLALAEGPDIVLCDLQMPVMNGYEVARGLRSSPRWRVVPLVAVTAFSMRGDREKALEIGFNEHLSKPIAPETFVQQIESFLANARQTLPPSGRTPALTAWQRSSSLMTSPPTARLWSRSSGTAATRRWRRPMAPRRWPWSVPSGRTW